MKAYMIFASILFTITSCEKYLSERPDKSLVIPRNVHELQGLLDHPQNFGQFPTGGEMACDDVYATSSDWASMPYIDDRKAYVWEGSADLTEDWTQAYRRISNANLVLSTIDNLKDIVTASEEHNLVKGTALFLRALNFYELAQVFSPQYSDETANLGYGIPLKITGDVEDPTVRSSVQETYNQIISDLKESILLLPEVITYKTRGSKPAAYGLLARTYLIMGKYDSSYKYADLCLNGNSYSLMDYNNSDQVRLDDPYLSFKQLNDEVLFHATSIPNYSLFNVRVDTLLYDSYNEDDLRKSVFFHPTGDGTYYFKGNYSETYYHELFTGISNNEILLTRAECLVRLGNFTAAMGDINTLLTNRWKHGTFTPLAATDATDALDQILAERRKELVFRPSLRWSDLRRLNIDGNYSGTLRRIINGEEYLLPPNDVRYTFLIPQTVISFSGIVNNPR